MHSTTGITDQFYSNMNDDEKKNRIDSMFSKPNESGIQEEKILKIIEILEGKKE